VVQRLDLDLVHRREILSRMTRCPRTTRIARSISPNSISAAFDIAACAGLTLARSPN